MTILWQESTPGNRSDLSGGAQAIRDLKTVFSDGVQPSLYWPPESSNASAGEMKLGTFRTYHTTASNVSLGVDSGRLLYASNVSRVYAIQPSVDTLPLVSQSAPEHRRSIATTKRWVVSTGTVAIDAVVTFPVTYDAGCVVLLSAYSVQPKYAVLPYLNAAPSATTFMVSGWSISDWSILGGGYIVSLKTETGHWIEWMALGSVSF
jgi:hypothetical protein